MVNSVVKSNMDSMHSELWETRYRFHNLQKYICIQVCFPSTQVIFLTFWTLTKVKIMPYVFHSYVCDKTQQSDIYNHSLARLIKCYCRWQQLGGSYQKLKQQLYVFLSLLPQRKIAFHLLSRIVVDRVQIINFFKQILIRDFTPNSSVCSAYIHILGVSTTVNSNRDYHLLLAYFVLSPGLSAADTKKNKERFLPKKLLF